jgi:hypothetical protein
MELLELSFTHFWNGYPQEHIQEEMAAGALVSPPGWEAAFPKCFPPFSTLPAQVRHCHLPLGNHSASAWSAGVEPGETPRLVLLAAFSRPQPRCYPLSYRPPVLRWLCADGTSSAQWTICVPCPHLQTLRREDARKGRCAGGGHTHPQLSCCQDVIAALSKEKYLYRYASCCPHCFWT